MWKIQWTDRVGLHWDLRGFYLRGNYCVPLTLRLSKIVCMCGRNCVFPADFTVLPHTQAHLHTCAHCHSRSLTDTSKYANASISESEMAWKDKMHWKIASFALYLHGFLHSLECVCAHMRMHTLWRFCLLLKCKTPEEQLESRRRKLTAETFSKSMLFQHKMLESYYTLCFWSG